MRSHLSLTTLPGGPCGGCYGRTAGVRACFGPGWPAFLGVRLGPVQVGLGPDRGGGRGDNQKTTIALTVPIPEKKCQIHRNGAIFAVFGLADGPYRFGLGCRDLDVSPAEMGLGLGCAGLG